MKNNKVPQKIMLIIFSLLIKAPKFRLLDFQKTIKKNKKTTLFFNKSIILAAQIKQGH
jgi:hypothetical protein